MVNSHLRQMVTVVRKSSFKWRYFDNLRPVLSYQLSKKPSLSDTAKQVLNDLNRDGIGITSVDALLGPTRCFVDLQNAIEGYKQELAAELEVARSQASDDSIEKAFKFSYVVGRRQLRSDDALVRFAVQKPIVDIVNAYFGMFTHLRFINVWHTFPTGSRDRDSQLWHRDRDDRHIVKVFVYLTDVDESAGPFTYAPGTHLKGKVRKEPRFLVERSGGPKRSRDFEMAEVIPSDRWIRATGPVGTIVFADTHGYHCGGRNRGRDRVMAINMFASSACRQRADGYIERIDVNPRPLSRQQLFALGA
jgi:ectoine hydroxylase-related dioxygenase (phytanoyl-CoA dioxygenase family)